MTRRAAHGTTARREVALGSAVTGTARHFTYERAQHGGMGLLRARLEQERHGSVAIHGVTTMNPCPAAQRHTHRHGTKKRERCKGRQGCRSAHVASAV
jgi:hypothetical protein